MNLTFEACYEMSPNKIYSSETKQHSTLKSNNLDHFFYKENSYDSTSSH